MGRRILFRTEKDINALRTRAWYVYLMRASGGKTPQEVANRVDLLKGADKAFHRYARGQNTPTDATITSAESAFPGSAEAFYFGPKLPGNRASKPKSEISLWACLERDAGDLVSYLCNSSPKFAAYVQTGVPFNALVKYAWHNLLPSHPRPEPDEFGPDNTPACVINIKGLLSPPNTDAFLAALDGNESDAGRGSDASKNKLIEDAASLLGISDGEKDSFARKLRSLSDDRFLTSLSSFRGKLADPEWITSGTGESFNPLVPRLELWRREQLENHGFSLNNLAVMTAIWRFGHDKYEDMFACSEDFNAYFMYVMPRILGPYDLVDHFDVVLHSLHNEWVARDYKQPRPLATDPPGQWEKKTEKWVPTKAEEAENEKRREETVAMFAALDKARAKLEAMESAEAENDSGC